MKSNMIAKGLLSAAVAGLISGAIAPNTAQAKDTKKAKSHAECKKNGCTKECKAKNGCGKNGCGKTDDKKTDDKKTDDKKTDDKKTDDAESAPTETK